MIHSRSSTHLVRMACRLVLVLGTGLALTACETAFYDAKTAGPQIETALGLTPGSIALHGACLYGQVGRTVRSTEVFPAACAVDADKLYVVEWDANRKTYRRGMDLSFAAMVGAAYYQGLQDEVQIPVDGGSLSLTTSSSKPMHDWLVAHGVKDLPSEGPVLGRAPPSPTPIYIYIPAR